MDKLTVLQKTEQRGGASRRESLEQLLLAARKLGCEMRVGGGRSGGMNIRYGSIGYAIMDVNTQGEVKLYVQPHPGKEAPEELVNELNDFLSQRESLEPKSYPVNTYSHLEDPIEDIPTDALEAYLARAVECIRETYYRPHLRYAAS